MENKKYCAFCKKIIPKDANFCNNCGRDLTKIRYNRKQKCSYCNIFIPIGINFCPYCGTETHKQVIIDETSTCDIKSSFLCYGGNFFKKNISINVFVKKNKINFKTFGHGECSFNIKEDFYSCKKLSDDIAKQMGLDTFEKKYFVLVFNDTEIIMEDNLSTKELISYIYKDNIYSIYESDETFYNTENKNFNLF